MKNYIACCEGYQVYRIWEDEFRNDFEGMRIKLLQFIESYSDDKLELFSLHTFTKEKS